MSGAGNCAFYLTEKSCLSSCQGCAWCNDTNLCNFATAAGNCTKSPLKSCSDNYILLAFLGTLIVLFTIAVVVWGCWKRRTKQAYIQLE